MPDTILVFFTQPPRKTDTKREVAMKMRFKDSQETRLQELDIWNNKGLSKHVLMKT